MATLNPDRLIVEFDKALRTLLGGAQALRGGPAAGVPEGALSDAERRHSAALMRVNHTGEVCAQAMYSGQSLTARNPSVRDTLDRAAREEAEHLAWTASRVGELGGRTSRLNPAFYAGAFALGVLSGAFGDRWNLGFLAETERQVEGHLEGHLDRLPEADAKSRAIVHQMKQDEARHAVSAQTLGAAELPPPVRQAMRLMSSLMTRSTYWI